MMEQLMQARINLANFYDELKKGLDLYKQEMTNLKAQLAEKDMEIARLKLKLNELGNQSTNKN